MRPDPSSGSSPHDLRRPRAVQSDNGTLWAWGRAGRPKCFLELCRAARTAASGSTPSLRIDRPRPDDRPQAPAGPPRPPPSRAGPRHGPAVGDSERVRLRQMKEIAGRLRSPRVLGPRQLPLRTPPSEFSPSTAPAARPTAAGILGTAPSSSSRLGRTPRSLVYRVRGGRPSGPSQPPRGALLRQPRAGPCRVSPSPSARASRGKSGPPTGTPASSATQRIHRWLFLLPGGESQSGPRSRHAIVPGPEAAPRPQRSDNPHERRHLLPCSPQHLSQEARPKAPAPPATPPCGAL